MTSHSLTSFPALRSDVINNLQHSKPCRAAVYAGDAVPREIIILAWAHLLKAYTGYDDSCFKVDEGAVVVSLDGTERIEESVDATATLGTVTTAISFADHTEYPPCTLWLQHNRCGDGTILSNSPVPQIHLQELGRQFKVFLHRVAQRRLENFKADPPDHTQLSVVNSNPRRLATPTFLHQLLDAHTASHRTAICFLNRHGSIEDLSYTSLIDKSMRLAYRLQKALRQHPSSLSQPIIPILAPQSPDLYIGELAISYAGAAFCPLALDAPSERIKFVCHDTSAPILLTTKALASTLPLLDQAVLCIDEAAETGDRFSLDPPGSTATLSYVMYTSGSTGKPKGVKLSHSAVLQALTAHVSQIPNFKRFLQFAAPTFDVSIFEIYFTFLRGATLVSCDRGLLLDDLPSVINRLQIDAAELTPTVAGTLLRNKQSCPELRVLLTIGEMLTRPVIEEFGAAATESGVLHAMYGPTEAAIHCTLYPHLPSNSIIGNIGQPLDTVSAFILDSHASNLEILPTGQIGELAIGGHQLADGYLNRPEQNAAAFVHSEDHGVLYRTGDRARLLPDGTLECLGRVSDGQVKLRGQRLELGEVEEVAMAHPYIQLAVASLVSDQLILFATKRQQSLTREDVTQACKQWLPSFMVPSDVVFLVEMPRSPSGKVDRQLLQSSYRPSSQSDTAAEVDCSDDLERRVCDLSREIIGHSISTLDMFNRSGMDSLRAIRLASRLNGEGHRIGASEVLNANSIQELSRVIRETSLHEADKYDDHNATFQQLRSSSHATVLQSRLVKSEQVENVVPCSPIQLAMLTETSTNPNAYCNSIELEAFGSPCAIKSMIEQVARLNPTLRSGFLQAGDRENPFISITWKSLVHHQIREVAHIDNNFTIKEPAEFLRPFGAQVQVRESSCTVLLHIHHALYDGWSWDVIMQDMASVLRHEPIVERPSYETYTSVVHRYLSSKEAQDARIFWEQEMSSFETFDLTVLNPYQEKRGSLEKRQHSCTTTMTTIQAAAKKLNVHPQVFFLAAMVILLSGYMARKDVAVGVVAAGRTLPIAGIERIVGPCIATLPLRATVESSLNTSEVLRRLHRQIHAMTQHGNLPLAQVKNTAGVAPGTALFDSLFVWQESDVDLSGAQDTVRQVSSRDYVEQKLLLEVEPSSASIQLKATYQSAYIHDTQIECMLSQIDTLSGLLSSQASTGTVREMLRYTPTQHLSMIDSPFLHEKSFAMHQPAETWAERAPNRVAVEFIQQDVNHNWTTSTLTYKELDLEGNRIAAYLKEAGVQEGEVVCLLMQKSPLFYAAELAISKAGAAFLPIAPETPKERIKAIFDVAGCRFCLVHSETADLMDTQNGLSFVNVDECTSACKSVRSSAQYTPRSVAYVIFTSGTTGVPKGVAINQQNIASNITALAKLYPKGKPVSRYLQSCSHAFDVSVFDIFYTWYTGGCLVTASKEVLYRDIEAFVYSNHITHLSMTPTVSALINPTNVPEVRMLVTAGEPMTNAILQKWGGPLLFNGYGPSETTNICTMQPGTTKTQLTSLVGRPLPNTSAFVFDHEAPEFAPLPLGAIGELCFGGSQVFHGYLNQEDLTETKMINHSRFGRIYRSGDLGRMLPDGSLMCMGRVDNQVKIRGQRIELDDVDSAISSLAAVDRSASVAVKSEDGRADYLVSFWTTKGSKSSLVQISDIDEPVQDTTKQIFERVLERLPDYMCPRTIVPLSHIPMTANDKLDRRRLEHLASTLKPALVVLLSRKSQEDEEALDELPDLEHPIRDILSKLVKMKAQNVSRSASLYSYGVDSITGIALASQLREHFNDPRIDVGMVLRNPSVAALARALNATQASNTQNNQGSPLIDEVTAEKLLKQASEEFQGIEQILPCTPLQEAMLSANRRERDSTYSNNILFSVAHDIQRLKAAWSEVMARQDMLRTRFMSSAFKDLPYIQIILSSAPLPWRDHASKQASAVQSEAVDVVDTSESPWSLGFDRTQHTLGLSMHHALYDGISMSNLLHEVEAIYRSQTLPSPVSFKPFLYQMRLAVSNAADDYWATHLQNFEPSAFPNLTGKTLQGLGSMSGYHVARHTLDTPFSSIVKQCQEQSLTLLSVCQGAWTKLLQAYFGSSDICFGNVMSGRSLPLDGIDRLVAPCFNTIPVRIILDHADKNHSVVTSLMRINAEHLKWQLTPLRRIQSRARLEGQRLFDTLFILQQPDKPLDHSIWSTIKDEGDIDFPLAIELTPDAHKDILSIALHYRRSILLDNDTHVVLATFKEFLHGCLDQPQASAFGICDTASPLRAVSYQEHNAAPKSDRHLLHDSFEYIVRNRPDSPALEFALQNGSIESWTFRTLDKTANGIAQNLNDSGVGREDAVIIHLSKSPLFYACILGVLKAGAAFTPFDPATPEDRKQFMEDELKAHAILTAADSDAPWAKCTRIDVSRITAQANFVRTHTTSPTDVAYRLYTSGSTGRPKAVSVEHHNAARTIAESKARLPWNRSSRLLQYASSTFDMCYYDCFLAWSFGFCLCAAPQSSMYNDLMGVINRLRVTMLDLTPSVASLISPAQVPSVELLYCIGEALPQQLVEDWSGRCINSYGPTEAAMCVTICPMRTGIISAVIGVPFESTTFVIVGPKDGIVPVFGVGELYIGGAQIAREYHANEHLTRQQFVDYEGQRFYKSGDRVRQLGNGAFEFVGRVDDQVKIRGLRVELDEINSVVKASSNQISDVTTQVLKASQSSRSQLVTFIAIGYSAQRQKVVDLASSCCQAKLPAYMVPSSFLALERIPLSTAGKVDKKLLLEIHQEHAELSGAERPGQKLSKDEQAVAEVLATITNCVVDQIHSDTTIFQLGIDSISAVQVTAELRKEGFAIEPTDVMKHPTLAGIAKGANRTDVKSNNRMPSLAFNFRSFEKQYLAQVCERAGIKRTSVTRVRPCTPFQTGSLAQFLHSGGRKYFNHISLALKAPQPATDIEAAFDLLVERHEMLRTGFVALEEKTHPFAMITYSARASRLPTTSDPNRDVNEWRQIATDSCLESMHDLPWSALIQSASRQSIIHLSMHHALYDATSLGLLLDDFQAILNEAILKPVEDSIESTLTSILTSVQQDEEAHIFWTKLEDQIVVNRFPDLTPLKTSNNEQMTIELTSSYEGSAIGATCKSKGITIAIACQAAWARLLSAYLGEDKICFGNVLAGRTNESSAQAVFPCITTVPIIIDCSQDDEELLQSIMRFNSTILPHQFVPLNKVQRWLDLGEQAPFDTLFAYQKQMVHEKDRNFEVFNAQATVEYPLSLEVEPMTDGKLLFRLTFLNDRIPKPQAELILGQMDVLVGELLAIDRESDRRSHQNTLSISPPMEPRFDSEATLLHELMERTVSRIPDKVALEFVYQITKHSINCKTWSYRDLDQEGNRVANFLAQQNITQGSLVVVCFNKCPEASFAMLGILKAGNGFVAIDNEAPMARKAFIALDSGAAAILTSSDLVSSFGDGHACPIYAVDAVDLPRTSAAPPALARKVQPSDTSYCLYTSGTTGTPKGCTVSHDNAVQAMMSFQRLFKWDSDGRWLQFAGYHFDVSVLEQYWTWSVGLCVVGVPREALFEDLGGMIGRLGITHIDLTPALAQTVDPCDVPSLCTPNSVFITGGEALRDDIIAKWGQYQTIYNGYGPTEATIGCTMYPRVTANGKVTNIGRQFDNVGTLVLKPGLADPVLRGAAGELCVYGPLVAKGYLNRPDKTAESFQEIELDGQTVRMYRTGDLVRLLHDGSFAFVGRADDQVKLRGQRIETREINAVVHKSNDDIADVMTMKLRHPKQQREQLVTFFYLKSAEKKEALTQVTGKSFLDAIESARKACREFLPRFAVPTHFIPVTHFPLSANNKVDAKRLKGVFDSLGVDDLQMLSPASEDSAGPLHEQESKIAELLCNYIGADASKVKKSTSIFELGLDSVSILSFARILRDAGYEKAQPHLIMRAATIQRLSNDLSQSRPPAEDGSVQAAKQIIRACDHRFRASAARTLDVKQSDIECVAPCTPLQQGMISRALESDRPMYFVDFRLSLKRDVDLPRLREAWISTVKSTQILRTRFVQTDAGHVQAVLKELEPIWIQIDCQDLGSSERQLEQAYQRWWSKNESSVMEPLEIVVSRSANEVVLALHIFHALYDGNSLPLILDAVTQFYHGGALRPCPAYQAVLPYGPLRQIEGARHFWINHLRDLKHCRRVHPMIDEPVDQDQLLLLPINAPSGFDQCRKRLSTTNQALVQTAWLATLSHYFGAICIGMVVSGRQIDHEGADRAVGPLFNTVPLHLPITRSSTWRSVVSRCHAYNTNALPYQHTPLRDVTKWAKNEGLISSQPLFDSLLVFQKRNEPEPTMAQIWESVDSGATNADYPLALEVEQASDQTLNLTASAQADIAGDPELRQVLHTFERALHALTNDVDAPISYTLAIPDPEILPSTNGHANGHRFAETSNGNASADDLFQWTDKAKAIREEIARMCGVSVGDITANASIFELGLDSVDAIKLSSLLKRRADVSMSQKEIMRSASIAGMCEHSHEHGYLNGEPSSLTADLADMCRRLKNALNKQGQNLSAIEKVLPVTPLQEAMVAEMLSSDCKIYFNHDVLEVLPSVDIEKLKQAWQTVVNRNAILRTSFVAIEDPNAIASFAQLTNPPTPIIWREKPYIRSDFDLDAIQEAIRDEVATAVDGTSPMRLTLLKDASRNCVTHVMLSLSHALYDGWSIGLLHHDVQAAYADSGHERPSFEPMLAETVIAAENEEAQEYWHDALQGLSPTVLASSDNANDLHTFRFERCSDVSVVQLSAFCKVQNVSLSTLTEAVFALGLATLVKKVDVAFGIVLSCRDSEESQNIMFPTMNTVVLRSVLHGSKAEMLRYTQETMDQIRMYERYPLRKALATAQRKKGAARLFDALFLFQRNSNERGGEEAEQLYKSVSGASHTEYSLAVEAEIVGDKLLWRDACRSDVFDERSTSAVLGTLDHILRSIVDEPSAQSLAFDESGVSVCGLPPFALDSPAMKPNSRDSALDQSFNSSADPQLKMTIREVLGRVAQVDASDIKDTTNIFGLGLDSISAIKVQSLLLKQGVRLNVRDMLNAGTCEQMAFVARRTDKADKSNGPAQLNTDQAAKINAHPLQHLHKATLLESMGFHADDADLIAPATAGQLYMLVTHAKSGLFHPIFDYRLRTKTPASPTATLDRLTQAWNKLFASTPALRTFFIATPEARTPFVQVVVTSSGAAAYSASHRPSSTQETNGFCCIGTRSPFVELLASASPEADHVKLKLRVHHALYDGLSLPMIILRLQQLMHNPHTVLTPSASEQIAAMSTLAAASVTAKARAEQKAFWANYMQGTRSMSLSLSKRFSIDISNRRVEIFNPSLFNKADTAALLTASRADEVTVQSLFLASYAHVYSTLLSATTSKDVVIGVYLANRSLSMAGIDLSEHPIPTLNFLPLTVRSPRKEGRTLAEVAHQVQKDIGAMSSDVARATTRLFDIQTISEGNLTVDTFVNFLALPGGSSEDGNVTDGCSGDFSIEEHHTSHRTSSYARVVDAPQPPSSEDPTSMSGMSEKIAKAYKPALDIEAAVTSKGELAMGLFCDEALLGLERGKGVIEGVKQALLKILKANR